MNLKRLIFLLIALIVISVLFIGSNFVESQVTIKTEDSQLAGTLAVPEGRGPFPAVLIIGGSGPFDRNGDVDPRSGEALKLSSTYRDIPQALSREGFVTLRYDKRGIGNSTGEGGDFPEPSLRDLKAAVAFLRDNPSVDPNRIALVGHSLGGLWALMEASEDPDIAAICLMATPAKPYGEVIIEQIEGLLTLRGGNKTYIADTVTHQRAIYDQLRSGELEPATKPPSERYQYEFVKAIMDIAGADYAKETRCPALILQGDKDLFTVIPQESELLKQAFKDGGNQKVKLVIFPNLDHMFRPTPGQPSGELYFQDRGPISTEVVKTITDWMKSILR